MAFRRADRFVFWLLWLSVRDESGSSSIELERSLVQQSEPTTDSTDRNVLATLYHATDGDNFTSNNGIWLSERDDSAPGTGVTTDQSGRVTDVPQPQRSNDLSGTIPPELGNLTALTYLYLGWNQLSGTDSTRNWATLPHWRASVSKLEPAERNNSTTELGNLTANLTSLVASVGNQAERMPACCMEICCGKRPLPF